MVGHPSEWRWCGHDELVGDRSRYRLIDRGALATLLGPALRDDFDNTYRREIEEAIAKRKLAREPWWTESIAVGSEQFVVEVRSRTRYRRRLDTSQVVDGLWVVSEAVSTYGKREGQARVLESKWGVENEL